MLAQYPTKFVGLKSALISVLSIGCTNKNFSLHKNTFYKSFLPKYTDTIPNKVRTFKIRIDFCTFGVEILNVL